MRLIQSITAVVKAAETSRRRFLPSPDGVVWSPDHVPGDRARLLSAIFHGADLGPAHARRRILAGLRLVYPPLEGPELRKLLEIAGIDRHYGDSETACAHFHLLCQRKSSQAVAMASRGKAAR